MTSFLLLRVVDIDRAGGVKNDSFAGRRASKMPLLPAGARQRFSVIEVLVVAHTQHRYPHQDHPTSFVPMVGGEAESSSNALLQKESDCCVRLQLRRSDR